MNLYFLLIASLQLISIITPVNPATTWVPLAFIFGISALKEAYDDYHRYQSDKLANERVYRVIDRSGNRVETQAQDIKVGQVIYLESDHELPCDIVVLRTSNPDGSCYVETSNLDGETDFKRKWAPEETIHFSFKELGTFQGVVDCASPNPHIDKFDSRMSVELLDEALPRSLPNSNVDVTFDRSWVSLTAKQLLLQGTFVKNTDWVSGVVVYTGNETKVGENKKTPRVKWTKQDSFINRATVFIFMFQLTLVVIFGLIGDLWMVDRGTKMWYLYYPEEWQWYSFIVIPLRFLLLNSLMIPISLKVTMDIVKYYYAKLIDWDEKMCHKGLFAHATSTAISEDLGQVQYLLTDKTGTLTENKMIFARCSINNEVYIDARLPTSAPIGSSLGQILASGDPHVIKFFTVLAVCHTVTAVQKDRKTTYKAASPDEKALVKAAARHGIVFLKADSKHLYVNVLDSIQAYEVVAVLEFTSNRKRMSVIVKDMEGNLHLFTKGADEVILPRIRKDSPVSDDTLSHLEEFAALGLRTLCIACKDLTKDEVDNWMTIFQVANTSVDNREEKIEQTCNIIETNLNLVGVSAIEDKLQSRVPETIRVLKRAHIKIWMLTGDKYTTAIQVGKSSNLILANDEIVRTIRGDDDNAVKNSLLEHWKAQKTISQPFVLAIEGKDLKAVLEYKEFLDLALQAASVICCRVTPHQKALIVSNVKKRGYLTLAVGDGGNDVNMIQEANVGVGIAGREGLQAARAADYSIARFYFLERLLLIHGRYSYIRSAFISQYCFYKSLFICWIQILFGFFSGFSGSSFFNTLSLTTYNLIFTAVPILFYVLDKDMDEQSVIRNPDVYQHTQKGSHLNARTLVIWMIRAFFQAAIVFLIPVGMYSSWPNGYINLEFSNLSMVVFTSLVIINGITVAAESKMLTWANHLVIWGTLVLYFIVIVALNVFTVAGIYTEIFRLFINNQFWLVVLVSIVAAIWPLHGTKYFFSSNVGRKSKNTQDKRVALEEEHLLGGQELIEPDPDPTGNKRKCL